MLQLVFYKVNNKKLYDRHSFDTMDDKETLSTIVENLGEDEYHIFENTIGWGGKYTNLNDLQEMYNDGELGDDYWCIIINV